LSVAHVQIDTKQEQPAGFAIACSPAEHVSFNRTAVMVYRDSLGRAVQEANARGKGGRHVLDTAIRRADNRDYDKMILLLDTDTDWSEAERARAKRIRIGRRGRLDVIESNPCLLEAWLLRILAVVTEGDTRLFKKLFKERVGCEAHESGWMVNLLGREALDEARKTVQQLADMMNHMGIPKP
jgi:hypothetical protein